MRKDKNFKANLPLVKYGGCVLTEDMVLSGTMEVIQMAIFASPGE